MLTDSGKQRRLALAVCLLIVFAVSSVLLGPVQNHWWTNSVWTLTSLVATVACFHTARALAGHERRAWLFFGLAALSWFAAQLVWDYLELVVHIVSPFPAPSDIGYLATAPLLVVGMFYYSARQPTAALTLKQVSNFGMLLTAMIVACIVIFFQPIKDEQIPLLYKVTALAYPVLYLSGFLYGLLLIQRVWVRSERALALIILSLGAQALANTLYAHSLLLKRYEVGNYLDIFWLIAFVGIYWAALEARMTASATRPVLSGSPVTNNIRQLEFLLPTAVLATIALLVWQFRDNLDFHVWIYAGPFGIAFVLLLALREWAVHRMETRLADQARDSEHELRAVLDTMLDTYYRIDRAGRIVRASKSAETLLGYAPEELLGRQMTDLYVHPEQRQEFMAALQRQGGAIQDFEAPLRRKDGKVVWVSTSAHLVRDAQGAVIGVEGTTRNISDRKRSEAEMTKLSSALQQTADIVMITDRDGTIEFVNPAFEQITGYSRQEAVGNRPSLLKSGKQDAALYHALWGCILRGESFSEVIINRKKDGGLYYEAKNITPLRDTAGRITHFISTGRDISEQILAQEKLQFLAHHDTLTELPNRALLLDRLQQSLARARWHQRLVAVLFMDLDRFKTINDSLGHDVGDQLLQEVGVRLRTSVRDGDTIARLGGDEFVVVLDDIATANDIALIAQKTLETLAPPFKLGRHTLHITASIGISYFPDDGEDSQSLLRNADIAMYRAKEAGKNNFKFYAEEMSIRAVERLTLENDLRLALERGEFTLHYQPQVDVERGVVVGAEALLRWQHPGLGLVSPVEFVPLLEETGLILPVGAWVLREACAQLRHWQAAGHPQLRMAVNLSGRQFDDPGLPAVLRHAIQEAGIDPATVEAEMTESVLMRNTTAANEALRVMSEMGVRLAIDDFGTGYSSLSYLKRFPIDILKIDRSFTRDISSDPDDAHIVAAILGMGANLQLDVIAEGVETPEQRDFLRARGCRVMQGYLFARPVTAAQFVPLLEPGGVRTDNAA